MCRCPESKSTFKEGKCTVNGSPPSLKWAASRQIIAFTNVLSPAKINDCQPAHKAVGSHALTNPVFWSWVYNTEIPICCKPVDSMCMPNGCSVIVHCLVWLPQARSSITVFLSLYFCTSPSFWFALFGAFLFLIEWIRRPEQKPLPLWKRDGWSVTWPNVDTVMAHLFARIPESVATTQSRRLSFRNGLSSRLM